jgi:DNA-directed RNA polymerase subunit RPC12/RpoP
MGFKETIKEGERLNSYAKKLLYKCPCCSKRFKSIPQRTIHSPFPTCPRCGAPVAEEHRIRSFDRTRKVLKVLLFPILLPFKISAATACLSWRGTRAGVRGIWRGAMFLLLLPLNIVKEYRRKRFASPEDLQKYLKEVQDQWKGSPGFVTETTPKKIKGDPDQVMLSEKGRSTYYASERNPHGVPGTVVNCMDGLSGRQWFIRWDNGKTGGPYKDEEIRFTNV